MTVYFANTGNIDLDVVRLMGVNIKLGENPFGHFGTGLKYAISVLLRTNHQVQLTVDGDHYDFSIKTKVIRGKPFGVIFMNEEQLGFTVDLGKEWKVWEAYRELHSNCLDEDGTISDKPLSADTVIKVSGEPITEVYYERNKIFLTGTPPWTTDGLEIYRGISKYMYYRGVRVMELPKSTRFTYNITESMVLTEDRTLKSTYDMNYKLDKLIPTITDPEYCGKIIDPNADFYDTERDFSNCMYPSEEFLDAIRQCKDDKRLNGFARELLRDNTPKEEHGQKTVDLTESQMEIMREACNLVIPLNCHITPSDFMVVETLGEGIYACVENGQMILTTQTIANGIDFCAITMYEEWIHKVHGYRDGTRAMQQYLFDKILALLQEMK